MTITNEPTTAPELPAWLNLDALVTKSQLDEIRELTGPTPAHFRTLSEQYVWSTVEEVEVQS